jgi:hypothetical protein
MPGGDWDPDDPPAEPPAGADLLVWRLAHRLRRDHHAHADGFCVSCQEFWPCATRGLAEQGLSAAFEYRDRRRRDWPGNAGRY